MKKIIFLLLICVCCTPSKKDLDRIAKERRRDISESIEKFTDQEFPGYTKNYVETYINSNDSLLFMGEHVIENEKEKVKIRYWATFESPHSRKFYLKQKGISYVMK